MSEFKDKYRVLYTPSGKAGEYAEGLAANPYIGCNHRCRYCYAPSMVHRTREEFHSNITPRKDWLKKLALDIKDMKDAGDTRTVFFSFVTDPYNELESELLLTRQSLEMLKNAGIPFTVLTKSISAQEDFDIYTPGRDSFGTTLTCMDDNVAKKWEPNAPRPFDRLMQIHKAKKKGIRTWISLEPVIDDEQARKVLSSCLDLVDEIKIGKLNYHKPDQEIDWKTFAKDMLELSKVVDCKITLKQDLLKLLDTKDGK